ncbi:MAG: ATP-binding protein [Verrucomicrobiota bacterium]
MKRGAGLGLTIAREVVVAHGGRVGVRSQPGQGSEFYFVLDGTDPMA